ncbi:hypothetical protein GCM10029992_11250 [Glycomyces albus]
MRGCLLLECFDDRQVVAQIGPLPGGRDLPGRYRGREVGPSASQFDEHDRLTFDDVRWSPAAVPGALDALDRPERGTRTSTE